MAILLIKLGGIVPFSRFAVKDKDLCFPGSTRVLPKDEIFILLDDIHIRHSRNTVHTNVHMSTHTNPYTMYT